jgi:hypothetical protein
MFLLNMLGYGIARVLVAQRGGQVLSTEPRFALDNETAQVAKAVMLDHLHSFVSYAQKKNSCSLLNEQQWVVDEFSAEERRARAIAATRRWRQENQQTLREKARACAAIPEVAQQLKIYRAALYAAKKRALQQAGYVPNPVGRPRKRSSNDNIVFQNNKRHNNDDTTAA